MNYRVHSNYADHLRRTEASEKPRKARAGFCRPDDRLFRAARIADAKLGRFVAVGYFDNQLVVAVVFRPLGTEALTVISMRPASKKERKNHAED
ncbi:hypothetical protein [Asticcacaulis sp.]|uniref:hypothetical protein n=1 Tax=Asticcacaulis sp. TaxID=1872648 RepID=UPI00262F8A50|nr:hypothetical protein [Asticcacaulis sp.]